MERILVTFWGLFSLLTATSCHQTAVRLHYEQMPSPAMKRDMAYAVYLPPQWTLDEALPLVVFLHGGGDNPRSFDNAGLGFLLDEAVREGRLSRAIIVVPEGNLGMWANWYDGTHHYEDWVIEDLMSHIVQRYRTLSCPADCHLMGISMGGYGTLRFVLRHPKRFATAAIISGPILDTDQMVAFANNWWWRFLLRTRRVFGPGDDRSLIEREDPYLRWTSASDLGRLRLFVAWGNRDRPGIVKSNEAFIHHLRAHDIPHTSLRFEGGHKWTAWVPVVLEALEFALGSTGN